MAEDDEKGALLLDKSLYSTDDQEQHANRIQPFSINNVGSSSPTLSSRTSQPPSSPSRLPYIPKRNDPLASKLKYFSGLRKMAVEEQHKTQLLMPALGVTLPMATSDFLAPPAHVLPSFLFVIGSKPGEEGARQSRFQTIASIVNTMMGTTIVALPYGIATTGIGLGILLIGLMGAISCFTCLILVQYGKGGTEFSSIVASYLGRYPQLIAWFMSTAIIAGAAIVYHILMQESLFQLVGAVLTASGSSGGWWHRVYAAMVPLVIYPVCNLKDMSALVKVNSLGFVFLWYTLLFILYHGFHAMSVPGSFVATQVPPDAPFDDHGALLVNLAGTSNFGPLGGMMMLSFFIHNCIQPILKNAQPKTQRTDIVLAYSLAGILYTAVGIVGYFGFADAHAPTDCVPPKSCDLNSNFLALFGSTFSNSSDIYAFSARVSLLLQLLTVYPLLLLIIRTQVFGLLRNTTWPGFWWVAGLNALVMGISFTFAALDLQISIVLRFTGAIAGLVLIFAIPIAIDIKERYREKTLSWFRTGLHTFIMCLGVAVFIMQFV